MNRDTLYALTIADAGSFAVRAIVLVAVEAAAIAAAAAVVAAAAISAPDV